MSFVRGEWGRRLVFGGLTGPRRPTYPRKRPALFLHVPAQVGCHQCRMQFELETVQIPFTGSQISSFVSCKIIRCSLQITFVVNMSLIFWHIIHKKTSGTAQPRGLCSRVGKEREVRSEFSTGPRSGRAPNSVT